MLNNSADDAAFLCSYFNGMNVQINGARERMKLFATAAHKIEALFGSGFSLTMLLKDSR